MVSRALAAAACAALLGCAGMPEPAREGAAPSTLAPGPVIRGGMLSSGVDAGGAPRGPLGAYTPLRNPIAVAASGPDLYVVDAAAGALLRIDPFTQAMVPFPGRPFHPGVRIAIDADQTLFVLDAVNRRVQRYGRDGRLLLATAIDAAIGSVGGLALDPARGRLLVADTLHGQLIAFRPLGRAFEILPVRAEPRHAIGALGAIAVGTDAIYAGDPRCACLARIAFDGTVLATFGHERVRQPGRLVVDRHGRLIVADSGERRLKIFRGTELVEEIELARFGLSEATDLALDADWLYVADGPGAQVRMLRVQPPASAAP
jgi:sugar lactone lactonase YvrE